MKAQIIDILKRFHLTDEIGTYDEAADAIMALVDKSNRGKFFIRTYDTWDEADANKDLWMNSEPKTDK